jgi:hypothetical protein
MITLTIEPADNGVVKVIYDDSVNGAGEEFVSRKVYDFERNEETKESVVDFLSDVVLDLGIDVGSDLDKFKVTIVTEIGDTAQFGEDEIKQKIKELKAEIKKLENSIK